MHTCTGNNMKTLIKHPYIITVDSEFTIYADGIIMIDGGIIRHVGDYSEDLAVGFGSDRVIDAAGAIVMPGLINAHTHLTMTLFRGYGGGLPLKEWLEQRIWPAESRLKQGDCYWGSMMGIAEMLLSGTTTFLDMYFFEDETARAVDESGIRAVLSRATMGSDDYGHRLDESVDLFKRFHNTADGRIRVMLGPHAEYTNSREAVADCITAARELGAGMHIHLSETEHEVRECHDRHGVSPVEFFDSTGLFELHTAAAHCVVLSDRDMEILKSRGVNAVNNPTSNLKLASGCAPVEKMLKYGINVALGTDGASSNNNLDMIEEMHIASLAAKGYYKDPSALPAHEVIKMATINGAKALGISDMTGSIEAGKKADLIMFDQNSAFLNPPVDIVDNIVHSAGRSDLLMTMVEGRILMDRGMLHTIDADCVRYNFKKTVERLLF